MLRISELGRSGFYKGKVANSISSISQKLGRSLITQKDFDLYNVKYRNPVEGEYKGNKIFSMSPPSSGGVHVIQILNILSNKNLSAMGVSNAESIHYVSAAMQAAFADRAEYLGDADFTNVPTEGLTSTEYAKMLFQSIRPKKAIKKIERSHGNPFAFEKRSNHSLFNYGYRGERN